MCTAAVSRASAASRRVEQVHARVRPGPGPVRGHLGTRCGRAPPPAVPTPRCVFLAPPSGSWRPRPARCWRRCRPGGGAAGADPRPRRRSSESRLQRGLRLGLGDPYFPTYGNRGYDVRHYLIDDSYQPGRVRCGGVPGCARSRTKRLPKIRSTWCWCPARCGSTAGPPPSGTGPGASWSSPRDGRSPRAGSSG